MSVPLLDRWTTRKARGCDGGTELLRQSINKEKHLLIKEKHSSQNIQ